MLVLLRVTIGWHFYSEGVEKYSAGDWDAKPFFANAKGPFSGYFRYSVWDWDGAVRLDVEKTKLHLAMFRDRVKNHYGFDDAQYRKANLNYANAIEQLESILSDADADIKEFQLGRERMAKLDKDPQRRGVASLGEQREQIRSDWMKKLNPTLKQIDQIWSTYESAQNNLATLDQANEHRPLKLGVPGPPRMNTAMINRIVPYFDIAIGVCLLLGLFTPLAALAAAGFLGSVFLSQYPPVTGPTSSFYQLIEGMACLVLAGTGAGRFGGLDFLFHTIVRNSLSRAKE